MSKPTPASLGLSREDLPNSYIGRAVPRPNARKLVQGRATYTDDVTLPRMAHAAFLRSPHAHARILKIDVGRAARMPGVIRVFTGTDLAAVCDPWIATLAHLKGMKSAPQYPLPLDRATWQGEAVVAVVADSVATAEDAVGAIQIDWEVLPAQVEMETALAPDTVVIHPELGDNLVFTRTAEAGQVAEAFAGNAARLAVVGATAPDHLERLRELLPRAPLLLPGVGAQGGRVEDLAAAFAAGPGAALVTVSRSIVGAARAGEDPAEAARRGTSLMDEVVSNMGEIDTASRRINELMPRLKAAWADPALGFKLFQVEFLTTLAGDALITLCYHRPIDDAWRQAAEKLAAELGVNLVGRSRGKRIVVGRDYVEEELSVAGRRFRYRQPEGAFTQPNGEVNQKMLGWAYEALGQRDDDLLELYCGNGNFTLPLATRVRKVLATEISKSSVNAALANLADNAVDNVSLVRLSAEELTQALNEVRPFRRLADIDLKSYAFGSVFVDPPRAGMDPDTCELARRFERILYISCNPETLAQNIAQLHDTHRISRCALFDQFPYTHHMESGVLLERR